jgi:hypothetical protein
MEFIRLILRANKDKAAKAQLQTTFAAGKVEIKRFFNWGIG